MMTIRPDHLAAIRLRLWPGARDTRPDTGIVSAQLNRWHQWRFLNQPGVPGPGDTIRADGLRASIPGISILVVTKYNDLLIQLLQQLNEVVGKRVIVIN